jgi:hypothetical protein
MNLKTRREHDRAAVLDKVKNNPGITAADIPVKQRGHLRGLERDGLIECREYGWYAGQPRTGNDTEAPNSNDSGCVEQETTKAMAKTRHLTVEMPDTEATIDFMGQYGCTIKAKLEKNQKTGQFEIYVIVTADDDRNTILGEILAEVPEADQAE